MSSNVLSAPEIAAGVFSDTASSDIAVSVRGLAKSYSIAKNAEQHSTLGEALMARLKNPLAKPERETFWALNDVNFDIQKGDVVGIIGRNGAGKSTLLKILSRITEPTKGKIDLYGRVGSLLEVGTGFHPELTGRENVYLNGAILGMQKSEIARQFDAIVDFSGTAQFLDTPVKRYSSGMYVRLAFAVAAHLNPEILIVDEVLAVGDMEFQKKCLGKMQDVAASGRTVLFVSHNMAAVTTLCSRAILLVGGRVEMDGPTPEVASRYQVRPELMTSEDFSLESAVRRGTGDVKFTWVGVKPVKYTAETASAGYMAEAASVIYPGDDLVIETAIRCHKAANDFNVDATIFDAQGYRLVDVNTVRQSKSISMQPGQELMLKFSLHDVLLRPGTYLLSLWLGKHGTIEMDHVEHVVGFEVSDDPRGTGGSLSYPGSYQCRFECDILSLT